HGADVYRAILGVPGRAARRPARATLVGGDFYSLLSPPAPFSKFDCPALPASGQRPFFRHLLSADIHLCGPCPSFAVRRLRYRRLSAGYCRLNRCRGAGRSMADGTPLMALALLGKRADHAADDTLHLSRDPEPARTLRPEAGPELAWFSLRLS